jgi:hypothetical protein
MLAQVVELPVQTGPPLQDHPHFGNPVFHDGIGGDGGTKLDPPYFFLIDSLQEVFYAMPNAVKGIASIHGPLDLPYNLAFLYSDSVDIGATHVYADNQGRISFKTNKIS